MGLKEMVYDDQIAPYMAEIIKICKANGIACLCDFALDGSLKCTTAINLEDENNPPENMLIALRYLRPRKQEK